MPSITMTPTAFCTSLNSLSPVSKPFANAQPRRPLFLAAAIDSNNSKPAHGTLSSTPNKKHTFELAPKPNHLISETSRYLVESAYDAVRWYPWGEDAFNAARASNKPILLSSGFLSCHMCKVMSDHFNDPSLARMLNERFICIKVDREERPDVDTVYNSFVQAVTGRSGWPLTCFLTPDLVPFVGTTYLPEDRLRKAVESISERWEHSRTQVEADGDKVISALRDLFARSSHDPTVKLGPHTLLKAFNAADACFDSIHGGFGSAPKFPRPSVFEFLMSMHLSGEQDNRLRTESLDMVLDSLRKMAAGGIHDHVGGGFFRYALDAAWHIPHFEKLLSDQVQLALSYFSAYLITKDEYFKHITCETLDFVLAEMRDPRTGAFYSALHADSESQFDLSQESMEGAYYTFSSFEIMLMLGEPARTIFNMRFGIEALGNITSSAVAEAELSGLSGLNVLRISSSIPEIAAEVGLSEEQVEESLQSSLKIVARERERRPHPATDDLSITCWNALAISAFARTGAALQRQDYIDAAMRAASIIMDHMVVRIERKTDAVYLARAYRGRRGRVEAFAEDYANAIQAFIDCYEVSGESKYLIFARRLQNALDNEFWEDGGYCTSKKGDKSILLRRKEDYDGAEPSSSSIAALNLVRMGSLLGDTSLLERARQVAESFSKVLSTSPLAMPMLLVAIEALANEGAKKVVVMGDNEEASRMLSEFWSRGLPRSVALLRVPTKGTEDGLQKYLSESRRLILNTRGGVMAYVCSGNMCLEPTDNVERFGEELDYLRSLHAGQVF